MTRSLAVAVASFAATLLVACGGDDDAAGSEAGGPAGGGAGLTVVAEDVDFGADSYEASAGEVDVEYVNEGVIEHSLVIEGIDGFRLLVESRGDTDQGSVELEPGSYRVICDIPGHAEAGMVADLEVS